MKVLFAELHLSFRFLADALQHLQFLAQRQFAFAAGFQFLFDGLFFVRSVDAIHLHMVLQHVSDPIGAFRVLRRVLKPGGVIAARDSDYGSFSWTPASPAVDRWLELYRQVARRVGGDPDAGRYLRAWALEAGYRVEASESTWVYETPEEREWWGSLWAERVEASDFADAVEAEGLASREELTALAEGWRTWAASPEGRFAVPCGEVLCWS